ncbi:probable methionine synthase II (cobalamin-independent) [Rhynchosporium agropyri]|uniref:Probable methionine synthase II (Cobalamin-independent) n=1 Tax=Rhynchosporium agropyri TaxID=914238 RepID=A0A1E1KDJ4_9HELO|nr:probable methionine synthase II (cobalamin-independent) [Rhynchosporium agropyri]
MSSKRQERPPFRAEHLGSLLRPKELLDERHAIDSGKGDEKKLAEVTKSAIDEIVKEQLDLGFHAVSDGEYPRHMFWGTFFPGLDGFEEVTDFDMDIFRSYVPDIAAFTESGHKPGETVLCTGKIKHVGSTYVDQWNYLKNQLPKDKQREAKLTLAAPNWYHLRYKTGRAYPKEVYPTDAAYFADIAKAYQAELQILYDNGLRNVQIDDPNLAYFCSEKMLAGFKADGESSEALLDSYIKLYNDCLSARPSDMHVGVHLCRGNFVGGRHFSEGGYDAIATKLFQNLNVDTYYLEYDTPRAGGFEPLKELPKSKNVILGLVTSKFPKLEDLEEMKGRVMQAAELMANGSGESRGEALKRVGVSPQCGFASHSDGNNVGHKEMIAKLKLVRELADAIWPGEP